MSDDRNQKKEITMLGIFNRAMRNATIKEDWSAPDHWKHQLHGSTYERQQRKADEHRARLLRDVGLR